MIYSGSGSRSYFLTSSGSWKRSRSVSKFEENAFSSTNWYRYHFKWTLHFIFCIIKQYGIDIFISVFFFKFCLDPDPKQIIPDSGKSSGFTTVYFELFIFRTTSRERERIAHGRFRSIRSVRPRGAGWEARGPTGGRRWCIPVRCRNIGKGRSIYIEVSLKQKLFSSRFVLHCFCSVK